MKHTNAYNTNIKRRRKKEPRMMKAKQKRKKNEENEQCVHILFNVRAEKKKENEMN